MRGAPGRRWLVALLAVALLGAACSDGGGDAIATTIDGGTSSSTSEPDDGTSGSTSTAATSIAGRTQFVDVYLLQGDGYATAVPTAVPATPDVAANSILALIAGPSPAQRAEGLFSSVPTDTELLGLSIGGSVARVDFSRAYEAGGGTFSMTSRLGQVVYTLTQFATVDEVEFWLEGEPVTVFSSEGLVLEGPVGRIDYLAALPLRPVPGDDAEIWAQDDLPDLSGLAEISRVVLVAVDDVLNVRVAAGVDHDILGMLIPGTEVGLTGLQERVGRSTWHEIVTPAGAGWVNGHFLSPTVSEVEFRDDDRVVLLLDRLNAIIDAGGDLSPVVSSRGLYVSHHADPVRFTPEQLATVLVDPTTYKWPSNAINMSDPDAVAQEVPDRTFAEAIGASFASTWDDPDRELALDVPLAGGNGRIAEAALFPMLVGFHYVSVFDPGDNPDFAGLDWTSWHVSIDYEEGEPVVVGLTLDQWAP